MEGAYWLAFSARSISTLVAFKCADAIHSNGYCSKYVAHYLAGMAVGMRIDDGTRAPPNLRIILWTSVPVVRLWPIWNHSAFIRYR